MLAKGPGILFPRDGVQLSSRLFHAHLILTKPTCPNIIGLQTDITDLYLMCSSYNTMGLAKFNFGQL